MTFSFISGYIQTTLPISIKETFQFSSPILENTLFHPFLKLDRNAICVNFMPA